ncbi:MAG: ATP-dependent RNA helicase [Armatimonadetes bacterium]|nr:ATP-dependent RNA helicase [Armatimonadota bacterium]
MPAVGLPIEALEREFLESLAGSHHLVVTAPTGSGKSTRVPVWCQGMAGRVLVVEPRRVACRTLARWVAAREGCVLGQEVGYSVRFDTRAAENTRILFVTPGVALQSAISGLLGRYPVLILDEFHERGLETDLLLALVPRLCPRARVVVMSATLDGARLCAFLKARWLQAEGRVFPVEVRHLGGCSVPTGRGVVDRVDAAVRRALADTDGSVLVFLPGLRSIGDCSSRLRDIQRSGVQVMPLHGSLSHQEQDRVFEEGTRKVVLSTNVAESSVTVPDITAVIDTGLVKQHLHRSGHSALVTVPISQASAEQRKGRAGRVRPGVCYRLWDAEGKLDPTTPAELMRSELVELVLWAAAAGLPVEDLEWLDPPPAFALERARARLRGWGALDEHRAITELGLEISRMPLPAERAAWLVQAPPALVRDVADLCAALEARGPLFGKLDGLAPLDLAEVVRAREKELPGPEPIQSVLALRIGDIRRHRLHSDGLAECRRIADQLRELRGLPALGADPGPARPDRLALAAFLLRKSPERAFVRRKKRDAWGNGQDEVVLKGRLDEDVQAAVMLEIEPIGERGLRVGLRARNALPCTFSQMVEAGLGTRVPESPVWDGNKVVAEVSIQYAGRAIGRSFAPLGGQLLRRALTKMVLDGRLERGLAEEIRRGCKLRNLQIALEQAGAAIDPEQWLERRLEELGVEEDSDWGLVSRPDLHFDALEPSVMRELEERYPPELSTGSARYAIEYDAPRRLVIMHWVSGTRNAVVNPVHLPRWNGWRVEVDERGRRTTARGA